MRQTPIEFTDRSVQVIFAASADSDHFSDFSGSAAHDDVAFMILRTADPPLGILPESMIGNEISCHPGDLITSTVHI
jgi:hypothetical protein